MADDDSRDYGTLIISALLILALIFAGFWIVYYVAPANDPQTLYPWFGIAAAIIVVLGLVNYAVRGRRRQ
jgi:uncharacterized BrkB/YihY/UPF0761 family membrane protein